LLQKKQSEHQITIILTSAKNLFSSNSSFFTLVSAETDVEIKKFKLFLNFVINGDHFGIKTFFISYHDLEKIDVNIFFQNSPSNKIIFGSLNEV
jgi:hypothetical protein